MNFKDKSQNNNAHFSNRKRSSWIKPKFAIKMPKCSWNKTEIAEQCSYSKSIIIELYNEMNSKIRNCNSEKVKIFEETPAKTLHITIRGYLTFCEAQRSKMCRRSARKSSPNERAARPSTARKRSWARSASRWAAVTRRVFLANLHGCKFAVLPSYCCHHSSLYYFNKRKGFRSNQSAIFKLYISIRS